MTERSPEDMNAVAKRENMLFVRVQSEVPWTGEQMDNLCESIDAMTDDDVGVVVMDDCIEFMTREQVEEYVQDLVEALE